MSDSESNIDEYCERGGRLFSKDFTMEMDLCEMVVPRQFLCCKICDDDLKEPKILPCLHTFCFQCIQDYISKHTDDEGYFPCPTCSTETTLSKEDVENIPDNILVTRLLSPRAEKVVRETLCRTCKNAGNFVDAIAHCTSCEDFLCDNCMEAHDRQEEFANHDTQKMEDYHRQIPDRPSTPVQSQIIPTCCDDFDPYDIGALFCVDCDKSVCADCHVNNHGDHRCAELMAVATNFEQKVQEPLTELEHDKATLQDLSDKLQQQESAVKSQEEELIATVKNRTSVLCDLIHDYERLVIDEIKKRYSHHLDNIKAQRCDMEMHEAAIDGVREFTDNLMSYGTYEEKVFMRKKVGFRIRELCEEALDEEIPDFFNLKLTKPNVTVETICNLFGELKDANDADGIQSLETSSASQANFSTMDSGVISESMDQNDPELEEILQSAMKNGTISRSVSQSESDSDAMASSNTSETMKKISFNEKVEETEIECEKGFNLDNPKRELTFPKILQKEVIKGIGVNSKGDILVGTTSMDKQTIYILEKHGIMKGQVQVENGWNIHSVSADGKVALTIPRGDNRFKVRVLNNDGSGNELVDSHVESFGLNFVTANRKGHLIITSNRYAQIRTSHGKSAKSGGNIAFFDSEGQLIQRITNDDFSDSGIYLLEKPQAVACDDKKGRFYVVDAGSHSVISFNKDGQIVFHYGNTDTEEEIYQGPDMVTFDKYGNVIVTDKREGRIDILSSKGELKKCFFMNDIPRYVGATPDKLLMTAMNDGTVKFYEYL